MKEYSELQKILYRQFLGTTPLARFLYRRLLNKSKSNTSLFSENHIFITGLARSGTTALLNSLFKSNKLASFQYKHMPFILSPTLAKLFSKLIDKNIDISTERYHKDGIIINNESPECLDEVFWIKSGLEYLNHSPLSYHTIPNDTLRAYRYLLSQYAYIGGKNRILVKNNNHHLRLDKLSKYFTDSFFFVLFRDPLSHSASLLSQHINFIKLQESNPFILEYMNLIGHREFGLNISPFHYELKDETKLNSISNKSIMYWLHQWIATYSWILNSEFVQRKNVKLICYEDLCIDRYMPTKICNLVNIDPVEIDSCFISANYKYSLNDYSIDNSTINEAKKIYNRLKDKSFC